MSASPIRTPPWRIPAAVVSRSSHVDRRVHLLLRGGDQLESERRGVRHRRSHLLGERLVHALNVPSEGCSSVTARADARTVIRLLAIVVGAAFLLSGCSSEEGTRAQELLQQAEQAQAKLDSATFEASVGFADGGEAGRLGDGRCSVEGGRVVLDARDRHPRGGRQGLSDRRPRQPRLDERDQRRVGVDAGAEGDERRERLDGRRTRSRSSRATSGTCASPSTSRSAASR